MAKDRRPRNKPDVPPEMAEAQAESGLPELPGNIPPYLAYKPSPDTSVALQQLQLILQSIDQKLRTSNHLQAHPMMAEHVLPSLLQLSDWMLRSQRDMIVYAQHLASWSIERHVVPAVPPDLGAALLEHLAKTREQYKTLRGLLERLRAEKLDDPTMETIMIAGKQLEELDQEADELEDAVEEEIFDEDEDWSDEDEDENAGEADGDDDDSEPADLVDTMESDGRPRKQRDPDAEPLF